MTAAGTSCNAGRVGAAIKTMMGVKVAVRKTLMAWDKKTYRSKYETYISIITYKDKRLSSPSLTSNREVKKNQIKSYK